ncbi:phosphate ABC transporter permease PtsA [Streptacidiphilus pinicola]|uniref:Phosphate transport system permease protein PstA n=1 Tax=Streptacidiphilus pinicola TaxID=2219663 RepID=A0A2X0ILU5_9ACTN|nr:phosphate ABC transporter permease PstA [Streptacidiphilus pinicola]RAG84583.1 phosphate ABC transporter permease PtsA [Streptacidiphilus pinicola]
MSSLATSSRPLGSSLTERRLPRWMPAANLVLAVLLGLAIGAGFDLSSKLQWGLIAAILFVVIQYVTSAVVEGRRHAKNYLATSLVWVAFLLALLPLISVLWMTISKGIGVINANFLTHSMNGIAINQDGGGLYHALIGTLEQVALASLFAAPVGILTAVYLVEYGRGNKLSKAVSFFVDVMTGVPSIVAGLFILSFWIIILNMPFTGFAGALALAILMLPVVVRSTEEMLKLVPNELREASLALGVPKWLTITRVVLPTALGGIVTGVMLAIARIVGETAPILMLVFGADTINMNPFSNPQSSLPLYVWTEYGKGTDQSQARAWGGALVLIAVVMILNLVARGLARWKAPKGATR